MTIGIHHFEFNKVPYFSYGWWFRTSAWSTRKITKYELKYFCMCWSQKIVLKRLFVIYLLLTLSIYSFICLPLSIHLYILPAETLVNLIFTPFCWQHDPISRVYFSFFRWVGSTTTTNERTILEGENRCRWRFVPPKLGQNDLFFFLNPPTVFFWMIEKRSFWKNSKQDFHSTFLTLNLLSVVSWYFLGCYHRKVSIKKITP